MTEIELPTAMVEAAVAVLPDFIQPGSGGRSPLDETRKLRLIGEGILDDWELLVMKCPGDGDDCCYGDICCHAAGIDPLLEDQYSSPIWRTVERCVVGVVTTGNFCGGS